MSDGGEARQDRPIEPLDLRGVKALPIRERRNLVDRSKIAGLADAAGSMGDFLDSLPRLLAANELRDAAALTAASLRRSRPVVAALGGHVVKAGTSPVLIDLLERGLIQAIAMNGACAIHDYEMALIGETSEDVAAGIADGRFGMARETAQAFAAAAARSHEGIGLGRALGEEILRGDRPHGEISILAVAARLGVPATVHVAFGTDVVHMHPEIDGAALGEASHLDFRTLAAVACDLGGGTWINIGSAVVMPEVFLKVVNIARNLGNPLKGITAINLDMLGHYRTRVNVLSRPVDRGISIIGHHEINLPLFRVALLLELQGEDGGPR